jgi:tyrosyl-tRNA synthetase
MSISDTMMWRYYELLTDVSVPQIEQMKADAASGKQHLMELKKALARRIVQDFHSERAAKEADANWAKQFQKGGVPENLTLVPVSYLSVNAAEITTPELYQAIPDLEVLKLPGDRLRWIRLDKLLFEVELAASKSEATRKIKEGAVRVGEKQISPKVTTLVVEVPSEHVVTLGRKMRRVQITP